MAENIRLTTPLITDVDRCFIYSRCFMRAVMSLQQKSGSKLKTVLINSTGLLASEIQFPDSSDGAQDLSGGRCFTPNNFTE